MMCLFVCGCVSECMYVAFLLLWHSKCIWDDCGLLICSFRWPESCLMMASPWGGLCKPLFWHPNLPKHSTYTTTSSAIKMKSLGTQRVLILSVRFSSFFFFFPPFFFFSSLKSPKVIYCQSVPAGFAVSFLKEITSVWMTVLPVFVQKAQCWNCETVKFQWCTWAFMTT